MSEARAAIERSLDRFIDALWIEDGLAPLTLAAYRRDLDVFAAWLGRAAGRALDETREADLLAYMAERHAGTRATTANRRLTVFKRYFRWALRERLVTADPTLKLQSARQPLRVPKTLTETQVETLLAAPDVDTPLGLRDRTMLELMYASGLRVSELVGLPSVHLSLSEGVLRVTGKGAKERLVPFGAGSRAWDGDVLHAGNTFVTAIGAGTTYPDYKPAPFIVSSHHRTEQFCAKGVTGMMAALRGWSVMARRWGLGLTKSIAG